MEAAFKREDETSYGEKDKIDGKISHKSVMYIAHDIFQVVYADRKKRLARKAELSKKKAELAKLLEATKGQNGSDDEVGSPTASPEIQQ